jgi:hypothetical protein
MDAEVRESDAELIIAERFRGPPRSGNGGYVCGTVARLVDAPAGGAVEVSLRAPPPLDVPLAVVRDGETVRLLDGDTLVAEGRPSSLELPLPEVPSVAEAEAAGAASPAFWRDVNTLLPGRRGVHPICFCCGDELDADAGLRVQPGALGDGARAAGRWTPDPAFDAGDGTLSTECVWTALDCPGQFAWYERDADGTVRNHALLARFTAVQHAPVPVGVPLRVLAWRLGEDGRKFHAGTALLDDDGAVLARARALWVRFDPEALRGG